MSDFRNTTLRLLLGVVDRCVSTRQITTDKGAIVRAFLRRRCLLFSSYQPTLACATPERPERACWRGTSLHAREDRVGVFLGEAQKALRACPCWLVGLGSRPESVLERSHRFRVTTGR